MKSLDIEDCGHETVLVSGLVAVSSALASSAGTYVENSETWLFQHEAPSTPFVLFSTVDWMFAQFLQILISSRCSQVSRGDPASVPETVLHYQVNINVLVNRTHGHVTAGVMQAGGYTMNLQN